MNKRNNGYFQEEPKKGIGKPSFYKPPTKRETVYPKEVSYKPFLLSKVNPFSQQDARKATGEDISDWLEELARKSEWEKVFGLIGQLLNNGQLIALDKLKTAIWRVADIAKEKGEFDHAIRLLDISLTLEEGAPSPNDKTKELQDERKSLNRAIKTATDPKITEREEDCTKEMRVIARIVDSKYPNIPEIAEKVNTSEEKVWDIFKKINEILDIIVKREIISSWEIQQEGKLGTYLTYFLFKKWLKKGVITTSHPVGEIKK